MTTTQAPQPTPILSALMAQGTITVDTDGYTLIGVASDGAHLSIGAVGYEALAERYLTDFPTPEMW